MLGKTFKKVKSAVTACDLFSTTELLRYKENPEFKSANGGICSIAVIIGFTIIFTQTIVNTFAKSSISSQTTLFQQTEPSHYSTQDSPFRFAVGINGYNLNHNTTKYFNIQISQKSVINGVKKTVYYSLIPCSRQDWIKFDPTLASAFDTIGLSDYLCLPDNISFAFAGKYTSSIFEYIKISVKDCKILSGDTRNCINSSIIDTSIASNGPISLNYYFVNTILNPGDPDYIGNYLEDRNYFTFTRTMGTSANIFISSYQIDTDESLWPWVNLNSQTGGIVYQPTQRYVFTPTVIPNATQYIQLFIRKSSLSLFITRDFKKYDDTLSYIGGLFSTFMVCLFAMMKYNEYCYQIEIASKIYKYKQAQSIKSGRFHILSCAAYCIYCIFDFFGVTPNWKLIRQFDKVRDEIGKQLDLKLMLRKMSFLEDCISYIFEDQELQCLHLKGKLTLNEAQTIRKRFSSRNQLLKLKKKYEAQENRLDNTSIEQNKEQISMSNHQVFDSSFPKLTIKQVRGKAPDILHDSAPIEADENSSDSETEEVSQEQKIYEKYIQSINFVRQQAEIGNQRCKKIYENLDKTIKSIPSGLRRNMSNQSKNILNVTEQKLEVRQAKDFIFLNDIPHDL